jgi:hypothetical protein
MSDAILGALIGAGAGLLGALVVAVVSYRIAKAQLRHDRELRDREHVRVALSAVIAHANDAEPILALVGDVRRLRQQRTQSTQGSSEELPNDDQLKVLARAVDAEAHASTLSKDAGALGVIVGPSAPLTLAIMEIAHSIMAIGVLVGEWRWGRLVGGDLDSRLRELEARYHDAVVAFLGVANKTVGWEPPTDLAASSKPAA